MLLKHLTYQQFRQLEKIQFALKEGFKGKTIEELDSFLQVNLPRAERRLKGYSGEELVTPKQRKFIGDIERFVGVKFTGETKYEASEYISFWKECIYKRQDPTKYIEDKINSFLHQGSVKPSKQSKSLEELAKQGSVEAQIMLAHSYETNSEFEKAEKWYLLAAEQGSPEAQFDLAELYEHEKKDPMKAQKWYQAAAEKGKAEAQCKVAGFYEFGSCGLNIDEKEALKWYRLAAEQGDIVAQCSLGIFYQNGMGGLAADAEKAVQWYKSAASKGHSYAQYLLGKMYKEGFGVAKDYAEAKKWLSKSAEHGNLEAREELEYL